MTLVSKLINSTNTRYVKNKIIVDSIYNKELEDYYPSFDITNINEVMTFGSYDFLFIDQDKLSKIDPIYKKFMPQIFVLDTMTSLITDDNINAYNIDLIELYSIYRQRYNCIFIALSKNDYHRSNFAHDLVYNIENKTMWQQLI